MNSVSISYYYTACTMLHSDIHVPPPPPKQGEGDNTTSRRYSDRKTNSPYKRPPNVEGSVSEPPPKRRNLASEGFNSSKDKIPSPRDQTPLAEDQDQ